jgi:hypothetical protein
MPYSLTKVGSQTADYKMFPFVEYYTCTSVEKEALRSKMNWNGMTVMRVGEIASFLKFEEDELGTFIQATPIRIEADRANDRVVATIKQELETGVYMR